jgi:hypothetical protein
MWKSLMIALMTALLLGAATVTPTAMAQTRGAGFSRGAGVSFAGRSPFRSFGREGIFLGDPFYADYPAAPLTMPSQFVVVQQPAPAADPQPATKLEPLMIELQGDRYVRFGGSQQSATPDYANSPGIAERTVQPELPPTVLVFRDGHREQVPEYAIVGSTMYASGDYWQTGHWTKDIQLSALNIPATIQANHEAGVRFTLPSAPNEVITRP